MSPTWFKQNGCQIQTSNRNADIVSAPVGLLGLAWVKSRCRFAVNDAKHAASLLWWLKAFHNVCLYEAVLLQIMTHDGLVSPSSREKVSSNVQHKRRFNDACCCDYTFLDRHVLHANFLVAFCYTCPNVAISCRSDACKEPLCCVSFIIGICRFTATRCHCLDEWVHNTMWFYTACN